MKKLILTLSCIAAIIGTTNAKITQAQAQQVKNTAAKMGVLLTFQPPSGKDTVWKVSVQFKNYKVLTAQRQAYENSTFYKEMKSLEDSTGAVTVGIQGGETTVNTNAPAEFNGATSVKVLDDGGVEFTTVEWAGHPLPAYTTYSFSRKGALITFVMGPETRTYDFLKLVGGKG